MISGASTLWLHDLPSGWMFVRILQFLFCISAEESALSFDDRRHVIVGTAACGPSLEVEEEDTGRLADFHKFADFFWIVGLESRVVDDFKSDLGARVGICHCVKSFAL